MNTKTFMGKDFLTPTNGVSGASVVRALSKQPGRQLETLVAFMVMEAAISATKYLCSAEIVEFLSRDEVVTEVRDYAKIILRHCRKEKQALEKQGLDWFPLQSYWVETADGKPVCC